MQPIKYYDALKALAAATIDGFYVQGCDTFVFAEVVALNLCLLENAFRLDYLLSFRFSKANSEGFSRVEINLVKLISGGLR